MKPKELLVLMLAMFLVFGGIKIYNEVIVGEVDSKASNTSKKYNPPEHDKIDAWGATQTFVERQLKSPASAEFPSMRQVDISQRDKNYSIRGYVDAQNTFGANLRQNFTAQVEYTGSGNWKLIDLEFE